MISNRKQMDESQIMKMNEQNQLNQNEDQELNQNELKTKKMKKNDKEDN